MVLSAALRRYEYLDGTFNPHILRLAKTGTRFPKYAIWFGLGSKDRPVKIDTKKDFEELIGWRG